MVNFAPLQTTMRIIVSLLILTFLSSSACNKAVRQSTDSTQTNAPAAAAPSEQNVERNRLGIPASLPYASDLELYNSMLCRLDKMDQDNPDMALIQERGALIQKLINWEKKYTGPELEEYQKWAGVASDPNWCK
jgi:hypothetical protein